MRKRLSIVFALITILLLAVLLWQTPAILRSIPSRYVARLPEPIQTLGARQDIELLPTAAVNSDIAGLLAETFPTATIATRTSPQIPTPPPTISGESETNEGAPPAPSPTPMPTATLVTTTPVALPVTHDLAGIEHRIQTWNNCGPATLSMALSYFELQHSQEQIAEAIKPDPEDRNVTPEELAAYVTVQTHLSAISRTNGSLQTVRQLISENVPVIIEYGLQPENEYRWLEWMGHYLLVAAYDDEQESVWVYDSWPRTGEIPDETFVFEPLEIPYEELDKNWCAFNRNYIAVYEPEKEAVVAEVIGEDMDDATMWQNSLQVVQGELDDEPDDAFLWFNLGTIFNAMDDFERAAAAFDHARTIGLPWRMLWYQFGPYEAYYKTGRYEEVILLADITLKDRPYFEESYYFKALAQLELGQTDEARKNLQRAVDFNPNFLPARTTLEELDLASN